MIVLRLHPFTGVEMLKQKQENELNSNQKLLEITSNIYNKTLANSYFFFNCQLQP